MNYLATLHQIVERATAVGFIVNTAAISEPGELPTAEEIAQELEDADVEHPEWIATQLQAWGRTGGSFELEWQPTEDQQAQAPDCDVGQVSILSLDSIYSSWDDELGVEDYQDDYPALAARLHDFRIVDNFAAEAMVGIYYDERHDPELYYLSQGEGDYPAPLGVDFDGYLELLKLSLGYSYWQLLLVELNSYHSQPAPTAPFRIEGLNARWFVESMTALVPGFSLETFMARYEAVRLRRTQ